MDRRNLLKTAALLFGSSFTNACERALLSGTALAGAPARAALDETQLEQLAAVAELIIPETDTPGAIAAGVPELIHKIVAEWFNDDERERFLDGLASVDRTSRRLFGAQFLELDAAARTTVLEALEAASTQSGRSRNPFFAEIKNLTVFGYYTSETAARYELAYRPVPGAYHGHAELEGDSRAQSTG